MSKAFHHLVSIDIDIGILKKKVMKKSISKRLKLVKSGQVNSMKIKFQLTHYETLPVLCNLNSTRTFDTEKLIPLSLTQKIFQSANGHPFSAIDLRAATKQEK